MKEHSRLLIAMALAGCLVTGGMSVAIADDQDVYENEIASGTDLQNSDIGDSQLEAFLIAAPQVQDIRASYREMIREAGDDHAEIADLRENAAADMGTAIQFTGIDVETYRAIGYLYQNDDDVRGRINAMAADMQ